MTYVRVPLTLAAALAFHVSLSPPTVAGPPILAQGHDGDRRAACAATARFIAALLTKGFFWASAVTDTLAVLAPHVPTSLSSLPPLTTEALLAWLKNPTSSGPGDLLSSLSLPLTALPPLPLAAIAGTSLALSGALLRRTAYDALGQFYACPNPGPCTCEKSSGAPGHAHALITTGPYAFVRHPAYAGLVLCTTGLAMLHLDTLGVRLGSGGAWSWSRSWSWGVGDGMGGLSAGMRAMALACALLITCGAVRRIRKEEQALRVRFKGEWEAWAKKVPYKLIPGVY